MEGALKEQIEELYRCRSDYSTLFQNFKQARVIFEDRDHANSTQLQLTLKKIESLERKVDAQKRTIAIQKAARSGFEGDVAQLKYATESLEKRERCVLDKHELVTAQNTELRNDIKLQSEIIYKQLADIEKLKLIVSNETVPKIDFERRCYEINSMKLTMREDMVSLHTHQQVKEKYADLQCRVEWGMIALDEYEKVVVEVASLKAKLEGSVSKHDFALLNQKLLTLLAENEAACDSLNVVTEARDNALLSASDWKSRHLALEGDLEGTERELIASRIREEVAMKQIDKLRSVFESLDDGRNGYLESTVRHETANSALTLQVEALKLQLDRESSAVVRLQDTIKTMKDNFAKESISLQVELESLRKSLMLEAERYSSRFESEVTRSAHKVDRATSLHLGELEALHDRFNEQLIGLYADRDATREAAEARHDEQIEALREGERSRLTAFTLSHQANTAALLELHNTLIDQIKSEHQREIAEYVADRQQCLESSLRELQDKHHDELVTLQSIHESRTVFLQELCDQLQGQKRKEEINVDLERIRADRAVAELESMRGFLTDIEKEKEAEKEKEKEKEIEMEKEKEKDRKMEENTMEKEREYEISLELARVEKEKKEEMERRMEQEREVHRKDEVERKKARETEKEKVKQREAGQEAEHQIVIQEVLKQEKAENQRESSPVKSPAAGEKNFIDERNAQNRSIEKLLSLREEVAAAGEGGGGSGRDREQIFEDNSQLMEIARSLEGCSFFQLIDIAAKGMMKEADSTYHGQSPHPHIQDERSPHREMRPLAFSPAFVPAFVPPFGSPGGYVSTPSRGHSSESRVYGGPRSSSPHAGYDPYTSSSPAYIALQQVRDAVVRDAVVRSQYTIEEDKMWRGEGRGEGGGRDSSSGENRDTRDRDRDRSSPHCRRVSPGSKRDTGGDNRMDGKDSRPPVFSSPPMTPVQPYRRQAGVSNGSRPSTSILGDEQRVRSAEKPSSLSSSSSAPLPLSAALSAVPPSPSREELLDRLINLSKEARGKGAGAMGFLFTQPL